MPDVEFIAEFYDGWNRYGECGDSEMRRNVFGAGEFGALKPVAFLGDIAGEGLHADGDDGYSGGLVNPQDLFECAGIIEIRMDGAEFDFVDADFSRQLSDLLVVLEMSEAVALHADVAGGRGFHSVITRPRGQRAGLNRIEDPVGFVHVHLLADDDHDLLETIAGMFDR
jgi:hypothetical protein